MPVQQACRGVRGAITLPDAEPSSILEATSLLLERIVEANGCAPEDLAAIIFTLTEDLREAAPGAAARARGWDRVPLLVVQEHGGATGMGLCLRVLMLWNTSTPQDRIRHVYLRDAVQLRPDLAVL